MRAAYGAAVGVPKSIVVSVGGVVGATVRWATTRAFDDTSVSLLLVNTVGSLLLGLIVVGAWRNRERVALLFGVGFCGALTTFSTLAVDVAIRLDNGRWASGVGLLIASVGLGIGAVLVGIGIGLGRDDDGATL